MTDPRASLGWNDLRAMTIIELDDMHRALDLCDKAEALARPPTT